MKKQKKLEAIAKEIENCEECKKDKMGISVPGEGNPDASIVFIGEAPGKKEAISGKPFIGRSGQLLRKMIRDILKLDDLKDVYITSPVKYLPIHGTPRPSEIAHGRIHLMKQLEIINPQIIVLMGNVAIKGVLKEMIPIKSRHGEMIEKDGRRYFLTLHPAAGLRFPPLKIIIEKDFETLRKDMS
jgi:DNA polymerase